jgi:uncharacterized membrane protein YcaP (DUF421 family)
MIYLFLQILMRLSGRRSLGEMTPFDFVLLLIISEATQQGLLGEDHSVMNAWIIIGTLVAIDILFSYIKRISPTVDKWLDGVPTVLVENGKVFQDRMNRVRVDIDDILEAARLQHGHSHFSQIKHAILEKRGTISIVPQAP